MVSRNLIVVVGPTAVGKTGLAIRLALHFNTEIVSADSRQIYRELEMGTAKPSPDELSLVKHHLVNHKSIREDYDAGAFGVEARGAIDLIFKQRPVAILVGGSGLYIKALLEGFDELPDVPSEVRREITEAYEKNGLAWLQQEVSTHDPDYFERVDRQNPQRLMRALEVVRSTGKPYSGFRKEKKLELPFQVIKIGLNLDRTELYDRIDQRMDEMIQKGLFEEAERFFPERHLNALQTVGYQEIFGFLENQFDRVEAIRLMKRNTRHYARRQLTWFRKDPGITWFHPEDWTGMIKMLNEKIS